MAAAEVVFMGRLLGLVVIISNYLQILLFVFPEAGSGGVLHASGADRTRIVRRGVQGHRQADGTGTVGWWITVGGIDWTSVRDRFAVPADGPQNTKWGGGTALGASCLIIVDSRGTSYF